MSQDLVTTLGLDDRPARVGMANWQRHAKRTSWQIARDFERAERAKERAARQAERQRQAAYQKTQRVHQVASVAIVAGIGTIGAALKEAAKDDANVAQGLSALGKEYRGLMADLGRDLGNGGMLGYLTATLAKARELRNLAVDGLGALFGGDTGAQRRVQNTADARDRALRSRGTTDELLQEINGVDTTQRDERRRLNETLNSKGIIGRDAARAREALQARQERDDRQRREQQAAEQSRAQRAGHAADLRRQAEIARVRGDRTGDASAKEEAVLLERQAAAVEKRIELEERGLSAREISVEMAKEEEILRVRASEQLRKIAEEEERRAAARAKELADAQRRHAFSQADMRVQLLRLQNRDGQADAFAAELDHLERVQRIEEDRMLTEQQRAEALALSERVRDAERDSLRRGDDRGFGAGLTGGSTLLRQIAGPDGVPGVSRQVELSQQQLEELREIKSVLERGVPAVAA